MVADWSPPRSPAAVNADRDDDGGDAEDRPDRRRTTDLYDLQCAEDVERDGGSENEREEEDDEEDIRIVGRKRRQKEIDPSKVKRQRIQQYYRQTVTYASPTAISLLSQVAGRFGGNGHVPLDITWQAILGLTDHYQRGRIPEHIYEHYCDLLKVCFPLDL